MAHQEGDRVAIVCGTYKKHGVGTHMEDCGNVMCKIHVDGDTKVIRNAWKTSIKVTMV